MKLSRSDNFVILFLVLLSISMLDAVDAISWKPYEAKHLKPAMREYYRFAMDAMIPVPQSHATIETSEDESVSDPVYTPKFDIYVRKFSRSNHRTRKHLWLISGGPGSSTSGIERALSVQLADTTIYIMDNRGLGHSHKFCHHSESKECQKNPAKCYTSLDYDPKLISIHETAKDYNFISRLIMQTNGGIDNEFYMYGSSYGATLAYTAYKFDPFLYSGILLEAFTPEFRLNGNFDVRKHVINSCFQSETCRNALSIDRKSAENLMLTAMNPETQNGCKEAFEFLAKHNGQTLNGLFNLYIRVSFYKKTGLRSAFLPLLYNVVYCPDLKEFTGLMGQFHSAYQAYYEESMNDSSSPCLLEPLRGSHCSSPSNTNHFFGGHIRFSEYSYEDGAKKMKRCLKVGYLNAANWADMCGMVSDYKEEYGPFLYEPEVPIVPMRMFEQSPTRLVIVTGKLDTQTLHDSAEREFNRLPLREKYMFSADHAGHGIIDSWEVPGFKLDLLLSFLMTGSTSNLNTIRSVLKSHNENPDRIWRHWDRQVFGDRNIWKFDSKTQKYDWKKVLVFVGVVLLVPFVTLLIQKLFDEESKQKTKKKENRTEQI